MKFKSMLKRFSAIALAGAITIGTAICASAADVQMSGFQPTAATGTLTVSSDGKYDVYKLYTAIPGNNAYTYEANSKYSSMLNGVTAKQLSKYDSAEVQNFLNTMMGKFSSSIAADYTIDGNSASTLPIGYYMVVQKSDAAVPGTVTSPLLVAIPSAADDQWVYNVTKKPKSSSTSLTKKIIEDDTGNLVDTSNSKIGSDINYQIDSTVPAYGDDIDKSKITYKITDNPSKALTVKMESITVKMGDTKLTEKSHYNLIPNSDGGFSVDFDYSRLTPGATVTVTFAAALNQNAVINKNTGLTIADYTSVEDENYNGTGNPNGATLEYTNNYYTGTTSKIRDIVTSFTTMVGIKKIDEDDANTKLAATFGLYSDKDCTKLLESLTTDETTGTIHSSTLKPGTYYLQEMIAPEGYAISDAVYTINVSAAKNTSGEYDGSFVIKVNDSQLNNAISIGDYQNVETLTITNVKGVKLPGTGGMGTALFTITGIGLMGTGAFLFLRRRMKKH